MQNKQPAFTLMEIIVATTLFAFTVVALTSLLNYTLKINRRAEALRQATQGSLDFVELIAKEVRNGQIDYGVSDPAGTPVESPNGPCPLPISAPAVGGSSYTVPDNRLGITDVNGDRWCFYLGNKSGTYVGQNYNAGNNAVTAVVVKNQGSPQIMNPPNQTVTYLAFLVQPICDPYVVSCSDYNNKAAKIQPAVTILVNFLIKLPTGEQVNIPYQTTVSTDRYDVPNSP